MTQINHLLNIWTYRVHGYLLKFSTRIATELQPLKRLWHETVMSIDEDNLIK